MHRLLFGLVLASAVSANPQGGTVEFGSATISTAGKVMTINQSSDKAILHWQRFENTPTETIRFNQPSLTSATLNRVVGIDPSVISGALQSNGQLFLINPNGIVFGPNSQVNVGGLVASSLNITDADFKNNNFLFLQTPGIELSSVINRGQITAQPGQTVALLAPIVDNSGKIVAAAGRVILRADLVAFLDGAVIPPEAGRLNASGKPVRMAEVGLTPLLQDVVNTQSVATANQVVNLGDGTVFLRGAAGIAVNGGEVDANGTPANPAGGRVDVIAHRAIGLGPNSKISAVGNGGSSNTGLVNMSSQTADILTSRAGLASPSHAIVKAGQRINLQTFRRIRGDTGSDGGLDVRGGKVLISAGELGEPGKPVTIGAGSAVSANIEGDTHLFFAGDVTVDLLFAAGFDIQVEAAGRVLAGVGSRTAPAFVIPTAEPPVPGGPPPPPPVEVVHVFAGRATIDAVGDIGTADNPLAVSDGPVFFIPTTLTSRTGRVFKASPFVSGIALPVGGAGAGLVDDLPVPRPRFVPPTDPVEAVSAPAPVGTSVVSAPVVAGAPTDSGAAAPAGDSPVIGGRDNVLLPALRGTYAKSESAAAGDGGGLIEVVRSTGGATAELLDDDSEPSRVANRKK